MHAVGAFEDAFILANPNKFEITGQMAEERETQAWDNAQSIKKTRICINLCY